MDEVLQMGFSLINLNRFRLDFRENYSEVTK